MNTLLECSMKREPVDWLAAKLLYTENHRITYSDLAKIFGVSLKQVKKHGAREDFVGGRQEVTEKVETKIKEKIVDESVRADEKHRKAYKNMQTLVDAYIHIVANHNNAAVEKAKIEGRAVHPNELFSPAKLLALCKAMRVAIDGERVTLGLPSIVVAPAGWRPSEME